MSVLWGRDRGEIFLCPAEKPKGKWDLLLESQKKGKEKQKPIKNPPNQKPPTKIPRKDLAPRCISFYASTSPFMLPALDPQLILFIPEIFPLPLPFFSGVTLSLSQIFSPFNHSCWRNTALWHTHHMLVEWTSLGIILSCFSLGWHLCCTKTKEILNKRITGFFTKETPYFKQTSFLPFLRLCAVRQDFGGGCPRRMALLEQEILRSVWQPWLWMCQLTSQRAVNPELNSC